MKIWNRSILPLGLALVILAVGAFLYRLRPTIPAAAADGEDQDPVGRASPQAQKIAPQTAPADDEDNLRNAAQKEKEDDEEVGAAEDDKPEECDDDWRNNMQNVPDGAKRAIGELARAGVRVLLYQHQDKKRGKDAQNGKEAPGVMVTILTSGASAIQPGFKSGSTRTALGQLLRSLPNAYKINLAGTNVRDDDLEQLPDSRNLISLVLDDTPITDKGIAHLAGLRELKWLSLRNTQIADAGLAHLRGMIKLKSLGLDGTKITDAGLKNLEQMQRLEHLRLENTNISDAGLAYLRGLPVHCLWLNGTRVTDAGLVHFKEGMSELYQLSLIDTEVTKEGRNQLLRDVPRLDGIKNGDTTTGGTSVGSTMANNPATIQAATAGQITRLKEVLWWLPADSDLVCVAQGPSAFSSLNQYEALDNEEDLDNIVSLFQWWIRPDVSELKVDASTLNNLPVALVVSGSHVGFGGCDIVVFERPLGDAGASFMEAVERRATRMEMIGNTKFAEIDGESGVGHATRFVSCPASDVLLVADNRDYLAEVIARMAEKPAQRALEDDLPEWKHLDLSVRQWAMRHFRGTPNAEWPFVGLVYSVQGGDVAKVLYLSGHADALWLVKHSYGIEVREPERNLIEATYAVRTQQNLTDFFWMLFCELGKEEPASDD